MGAHSGPTVAQAHPGEAPASLAGRPHTVPSRRPSARRRVEPPCSAMAVRARAIRSEHAGQVVDAEQAPGGGLPHRQQVAQVAPATTGAQVGQPQAGSSGPSSRAWTALRRLSRPGRGQDGAVPGHAGSAPRSRTGRHPRAIASTIPTGSPTPIRYRGRSAGRWAQWPRQRLEHGRARLAHRQPSDAVPVELQLHRASGALVPQHRVGPPLDDPEEGLALGTLLEPVVVRPGPGRPRRRPLHAPPAAPRGWPAGWRTRRAPSGCRRRSGPGPRRRTRGSAVTAVPS